MILFVFPVQRLHYAFRPEFEKNTVICIFYAFFKGKIIVKMEINGMKMMKFRQCICLRCGHKLAQKFLRWKRSAFDFQMHAPGQTLCGEL